MKKNKRSLVVLMLAMLVMGLVACGKGNGDSELTEITPGVGATISENSSTSSDSATEVSDLGASVMEETKDDTTDTVSDNSVSDNSVSTNTVSDNDASDVEDDKDKVKEVNRDDIEVLSESITMYVQSAANVRKGPGTDFDIVGSLKQNDTVEVIGKCKSVAWFEIKRGNDSAFVYSGLLGDSEVVPVVLDDQAQAVTDPTNGQEQPTNTTATDPAVAPAAPSVAPPPVVATAGNVVFIGDSRTCQMQQATGGSGVDWVCQYGAKYDWFANTAISKADPLITAGTKVVICMGVNDPDRVSDYAACVNNNVWSWVGRGAKVYYVSVNPVEEPYINEKAAAIENFNASMPGRLQGGVVWIDTYSIIKANPAAYPFVDGIHFDSNANIAIFRMIYGCLR